MHIRERENVNLRSKTMVDVKQTTLYTKIHGHMSNYMVMVDTGHELLSTELQSTLYCIHIRTCTVAVDVLCILAVNSNALHPWTRINNEMGGPIC